METVTLYELNSRIRGILEDTMDQTYWVHGELSEGRQGPGGHFYGELIERDEETDTVVARARINIWARTYSILSLRFHEETGQNLRPGMKVLVKAKVSFHEAYGYALTIQDIDGTYTLGDLERRRQEILRQLEKDGIINDNKTLPLPTLLRRIAIVSSPNAAGYGDFCNQLQGNEYGFAFQTRLYTAIMQGQQAPDSIIGALQRIEEDNSVLMEHGSEPFDVVVIIRGGGAVTDLCDFDSYPLAACIAQYPVPVIVGIGHERDRTVLDFVSHESVKTPTAAAAFVIDHQAEVLAHLQDLAVRVPQMVRMRVESERQRIHRIASLLPVSVGRLHERLKHRLDMLEQRILGLNPEVLQKRGYSITKMGDKVLHNAMQVQEGDVLITRLEHGEVLSKVICRLG